MTLHIAKAKVVKVSIGPDGGNTVARIIRQGDIVPEGVGDEHLKSLIERGLIEKVKDEVSASAESSAVEIPDGEPTLDWKGDQLKAFADRESIDLGSAKNKPDMLAAIVAAKGAGSQPSGDEQQGQGS